MIIATIALVIFIVGPWVARAIGNQFNLVSETLGEGTDGNAFKDPVDIPDPERGTAFAVYSADDNSLMFYKRRGVPQLGDMFNDRRVTDIYTGFETAYYRPTADDYATDPDGYNKAVNTPWYGVHALVKSVRCVDSIRPVSMSYWFQHFQNCTAFDLSKVDTSACASFAHTFFACRAVAQLNLDGWDMTRAGTVTAMFAGCRKLTSLKIASWDLSRCQAFIWMFSECSSLVFDCSDWDVRPNAEWKNFNTNSPGVTIPKAWQNDWLAAAARPAQPFGIALRSARIANPERREPHMFAAANSPRGGSLIRRSTSVGKDSSSTY